MIISDMIQAALPREYAFELARHESVERACEFISEMFEVGRQMETGDRFLTPTTTPRTEELVAAAAASLSAEYRKGESKKKSGSEKSLKKHKKFPSEGKGKSIMERTAVPPPEKDATIAAINSLASKIEK